MDKLGTHIIELLNENPEVYLPGIGTFKKERVPAVFDESTNSFLAPTQRIVLHEVQGSAAPLVRAICEGTGSSIEACEEQLKIAIGAILLELNEKGESEIPNLGTLLKEDGMIRFSPKGDEEGSLPLHKSVKEFKLIAPPKEVPGHVVIVDDSQDAKVDQEEPVLVNDTILASEQLPAEEAVEIASSYKSELPDGSVEQEFEPKGRSINWLWPILIILILAVAGIFLYLNPLKEGLDPVLIEEIPTEEQIADSIAIRTVPLDVDSLSKHEIDTLSALELEPVEGPVQERISYEIIIVSFGKLAEAEKYVESMNLKGLQLRVLVNRRAGNLFKVSAGSFNTEEEAQIELNKVRENLSKDAWVYKAKH